MIRRLLFWLSGYLPARQITDDGQPYLERYYLFSLFGWTVYLHRFVAPDPDRGLHDHPWSHAVSFILSGSYYEHKRDGVHHRRWFNYIQGDTFHRVAELVDGLECWTIFAHGERSKTWGFWRPRNHGTSAEWNAYAYLSPSGPPLKWWLNAPQGRFLVDRKPTS